MEPTDTDLQPLVADCFAALADALAPLPESRWDEPTLCEGWSVRHVVAHLTMAARYDGERFGAELAADGFDFQRMSDRIADRDAALPVASLVGDLRSDTMATFAMPGGGIAGSLSHVVIHGLDVTLPLGLGRTSSDAAARTVLDALAGAGGNALGTDPEGWSLRATDLDWSWGEGRPLEATAGELVAWLAHRAVPGPPGT